MTRALVVLAAALALAGCHRAARDRAIALVGGDPDRGRLAIRNYGCGACHTVAGVPGATGTVAPELTNVTKQAYVAGVLQTTPDNLIRWIMMPQHIDPRTAMPEIGVPESDARNIATYLYALR